MKLFMLVFLSLLLAPRPASAGPLYGTVRIGTRPAAGVTVMVACPSFARSAEGAASAPADPRGSFTLRVQHNGRCEMRARSGNALGAPFPVFSSENSLRYDFQVDEQMNRVP